MSVPTIIVPGGTQVSSVYAKSVLGTPGADLSTTSGSAVEISTTLRVTLTVPASGNVLVRHNLIANNSNPQDAFTYVQVDGTGPWTQVAASTLNQGGNFSIPGEVELTGLTPGSHTFYMGWSTSGGNTLHCMAHSFGGVAAGTYQSVQTIP